MYYIYFMVDLSKPEVHKTDYVTLLYKPFYVGKAYSDHRVVWHKHDALRAKERGGSRTHKQNTILKMIDQFDEMPYVIVPVSKNEENAYNIENCLIEHFGLYSEGGILTNVLHGGKGGKRNHFFCKDEFGTIHHIPKDDARVGVTMFPVYEKGYLLMVDSHGNIERMHKNDERMKSKEYKNLHQGRKRSNETRNAISEGKLNYTFTDEHLRNVTEANRKIAENCHKGAKRSKETCQKISQSRIGHKSKVAKYWSVTSSEGINYTFKGGLKRFCDIFNLSFERIRKAVKDDAPIEEPTHTGHLNQSVYNCTGWLVNKGTEEDINFYLL